MSKNKME
jgi:predicted nucleotide-binding protein